MLFRSYGEHNLLLLTQIMKSGHQPRADWLAFQVPSTKRKPSGKQFQCIVEMFFALSSVQFCSRNLETSIGLFLLLLLFLWNLLLPDWLEGFIIKSGRCESDRGLWCLLLTGFPAYHDL